MTSTKTQNLQGWSSGYTMDIFNISKTFLNDKLSVNLGTAALLSKNIKINSYRHGSDYETISHTTIPIRMIALSVSYSFGDKKTNVKKSQKTINNDDLINKQSQSEQIGTIGANN